MDRTIKNNNSIGKCHIYDNQHYICNIVASGLFSPKYSFKQFKKKRVCHTLALPFILKSITRQRKKNYGNSNISPCKNIVFKKSSERNQNPSRYYNSIITNLKFQQNPKYHLKKNPHIKTKALVHSTFPNVSHHLPHRITRIVFDERCREFS